MLARALGPVWRPHAAQLLEGIMLTGLSEVQVNALIEVRLRERAHCCLCAYVRVCACVCACLLVCMCACIFGGA